MQNFLTDAKFSGIYHSIEELIIMCSREYQTSLLAYDLSKVVHHHSFFVYMDFNNRANPAGASFLIKI